MNTCTEIKEGDAGNPLNPKVVSWVLSIRKTLINCERRFLLLENAMKPRTLRNVIIETIIA